ncbi:MAG: response regulator [Polyangiaceae bacterium]|nr:response regulator [Polyangiaceae bacterium]
MSSPDMLVDETPRREVVWVVEDSPLEARMARQVLEECYDLEFFGEGLMVLERLAAGPTPDAILLDAHLPDTTGREVCRSVRERFDEIALPVLFLTAQSRSEDIVAGLEVGANDYMTKPYRAAELLARLATLLRIRRLELSARRREAYYRGIVSALSEGILVHDPDGVVLTVNPAAEAIFGMRAGELAGRLASDLGWHPLDDAGAPLEQALRDGTARRNVPMSLRRPDGASIELSVNVLPLRHPDTGEIAGVVSSFFDVTEQRRIERERDDLHARERDARVLAEAANQSKDEFLATTSHELRTPLNAILGWTRMLRTGNLDPAARERAVSTVERNALVQVQLIEDLLDVSRVVSGKLRLDVVALDVGAIVREAAESIRPAAEAKNIALGLDLGPPAYASGDPDRLQQVVWNLLSNAVKFTPAGGRIDVRLERVGTVTQLTVSDSGQGISAEFLPYVFDRFRQANGSSSRRHSGLGLGLALVRSLIELHGGTVRVESEGEGRGSLFTITLPVRAVHDPPTLPAPAANANPTADLGKPVSTTDTDQGVASVASVASVAPVAAVAVAPASVVSPSRVDGVRVLVVDDEEDARELIATVLRLHGARVVVAGSADEAIAAFEREAPDVLISDIGMPQVDGYELMRRVRNRPASQGGAVWAAALTAYDRTTDRRRAIAAGFDVYVGKPVEPSELVATVARLSGRSSTNGG